MNLPFFIKTTTNNSLKSKKNFDPAQNMWIAFKLLFICKLSIDRGTFPLLSSVLLPENLILTRIQVGLQ